MDKEKILASSEENTVPTGAFFNGLDGDRVRVLFPELDPEVAIDLLRHPSDEEIARDTVTVNWLFTGEPATTSSAWYRTGYDHHQQKDIISPEHAFYIYVTKLEANKSRGQRDRLPAA